MAAASDDRPRTLPRTHTRPRCRERWNFNCGSGGGGGEDFAHSNQSRLVRHTQVSFFLFSSRANDEPLASFGDAAQTMWSAIAGVVVMCDAEVRHPISCGRGGLAHKTSSLLPSFRSVPYLRYPASHQSISLRDVVVPHVRSRYLDCMSDSFIVPCVRVLVLESR